MSEDTLRERMYRLIDKWADEYVETEEDKYDIGYLAGISHCMMELDEELNKE
jgi:hypothetical protein